MSAHRRGWCPSLYEPMMSGDGLLVRVKPRCATLTAAQARAVAAGSLRFGNGVLGVTNRGNLQVRGLARAAVTAFAAAMVAAGLASDDPGVEQLRNVLVSPLVGDDPGIASRTREIACDVERVMTQGIAVPGKFGIAIDGGGVLPLGIGLADITVAVSDTSCRVILPDGAFAACAAHDAAAACRALVETHLAVAPGARIRDALRLVPTADLMGRAGLRIAGREPSRPEPDAVGFHPYAATRGALGVAPPFGRLDANALAELADACERFGDATLRVTPWRTIMVAAVASDRRAAVTSVCASIGMIVDPADARLRVVACPGAPACPAATVPTHEDAALIAAIADGNYIHVSGCAKGCAHPRAAPVTLVGRDGRYDIVRNGHAGEAPVRAGLTMDDVSAWLLEQAA